MADVSRAILKVTQGDEILGIERKWLGQNDEVSCNSLTNASGSGSVVTWSSLKGVFFISMGLLVAAGIVYTALKYMPWGTVMGFLPCGQGRRQENNGEPPNDLANGDARDNNGEENGLEEGHGEQQVVEVVDQHVVHGDKLPLRRNQEAAGRQE